MLGVLSALAAILDKKPTKLRTEIDSCATGFNFLVVIENVWPMNTLCFRAKAHYEWDGVFLPVKFLK